MKPMSMPALDEVSGESSDLDFKASFDPSAMSDWCELIKDVVAMANSGGGWLVIGVNDDGSPSGVDLTKVAAVDPAIVIDKVKKYTGQHFAGFTVMNSIRHGFPTVVIAVSPSPIPMVFVAPGNYDVGGGKQKSAFSMGTVYFRHGAKSEPGTSDDLRAALDREIDRIRSSWLEGIKKVVMAPTGSAFQVVASEEVKLTGDEIARGVRLVNDEHAPAFKAVRTDDLYPYRQTELIARVNGIVGGKVVVRHDVECVRKHYQIALEPSYYYKPQFSSPQYSEAFAQWMVAQYQADKEFFIKAREACKKGKPL